MQLAMLPGTEVIWLLALGVDKLTTSNKSCCETGNYSLGRWFLLLSLLAWKSIMRRTGSDSGRNCRRSLERSTKPGGTQLGCEDRSYPQWRPKVLAVSPGSTQLTGVAGQSSRQCLQLLNELPKGAPSQLETAGRPCACNRCPGGSRCGSVADG